MATDIKLDQIDGSYIIVESRVVKVEGSDFILDDPHRHKGGKSLRRALVHDQTDGLTLNFNGDYPGGINLVNVKNITPLPDSKFSFPTLSVQGGISYEAAGINLKGVTGKVTVFLDGELGKLQMQIAELNDKVSKLEKLLNK